MSSLYIYVAAESNTMKVNQEADRKDHLTDTELKEKKITGMTNGQYILHLTKIKTKYVLLALVSIPIQTECQWLQSCETQNDPQCTFSIQLFLHSRHSNIQMKCFNRVNCCQYGVNMFSNVL